MYYFKQNRLVKFSQIWINHKPDIMNAYKALIQCYITIHNGNHTRKYLFIVRDSDVELILQNYTFLVNCISRASDLRCARTNDARFQKNGTQLFKVMNPMGASFLVVNKS